MLDRSHLLVVFMAFMLSWLLPTVSQAASSQKLNNDAATGSDELDIPEPLVFDLVRPLGSPQGELEVNFFASRINGQGQLSWSPEIEYVIADGYAVELELPHTNGSLDEYKMALQGTAGTLLGGQHDPWMAIHHQKNARWFAKPYRHSLPERMETQQPYQHHEHVGLEAH